MSVSFGAAWRATSRRKTSQKRQREKFTQESVEAREKAIAQWYKVGGYKFLRWTKKYYRLSTGEELSWEDPFLDILYLFLGTGQLEVLVIQKSAQIGYTEGLIALAAFCLAYLRSPIGFGFEEKGKLNTMVGTRIQPAFDNCEPIQQIDKERHKATGREDIDAKSSITVGGVPASFFYANIKGGSEEQAPSAQRSWGACFIFADEFGLWRSGVLDTMISRMSASKLRSKPVRAGSTPSFEGSVLDTEVKGALHAFEWQVECPHCQQKQFLDAFGNFLQGVLVKDDNVEQVRYIDKTGRPLKWFHKSANPDDLEDKQLSANQRQEAISSAYIGCQHCGEEIPRTTIDEGKFVCTHTGVEAKEFLDKLIASEQVLRQTVALILPPLASHRFSASERIGRLWATRNPTDEIQQQLGKSISLSGGKIDLQRLMACVGLPLPPQCDRQPDLVVLGIDQGSPFYSVIQEWYMSDAKDKEVRWEEAHVKTVWWGEINSFEDVDDLAKKYNVDLIGMDHEPERRLASEYALKHLPYGVKIVTKDGNSSMEVKGKDKKGQVYLFDQMELEGAQFKRVLRSLKSTKKETEVPVYDLDRTYGLDCVRSRIYRGRMHFPAGMTYNPKDRGNFLYHFVTSDRLPNERWQEAPGTPDHYFHATNFAEMAVLVSLTEPGVSTFAYTFLPYFG